MSELRTLLNKTASRIWALLHRAGLVEISILLTIALSAASFLAFVELAEEMHEDDTRAFDIRLLMVFRNPTELSDPVGPPWFEEMMRDFTALGSFAVLLTVTLATFGFLVLTQKRHAAWMVLGSVTSGMLVSNLLKWGFARPRPDLVPHATSVYTQSFPSGHAMLSAVAYLTLGALLARTQAKKRVKVYLLAIAVTLMIVVGVSRVYLGVHWPTDILAGWAGGAGWALFCWAVMLWLQSRGKVEPPSDGGRSV